MRDFIILVLLIAVGYLSWKQYGQNPTEQQKQPNSAPQSSTSSKPQIAPEGILYVTKPFSVTTESGIYGFPAGKSVTVVSREAGYITVGDGKITTKATEDHFTDNLTVVASLQEEKQKQQTEIDRANASIAQKRAEESANLQKQEEIKKRPKVGVGFEVDRIIDQGIIASVVKRITWDSGAELPKRNLQVLIVGDPRKDQFAQGEQYGAYLVDDGIARSQDGDTIRRYLFVAPMDTAEVRGARPQ